MRQSWVRMVQWLVMVVLLTGIWGTAVPPQALASDAYDAMREKRKVMLTGETGLTWTDPDLTAAAARITDQAEQYWSTMNVSPSRTHLWSDQAGTGNSIHIRITYERLKALALAYATEGSELHGDPTLATDLIGALDYMYATRYHEHVTTTPSGTSNWWDWQIGIPMQLGDIVILMYDQLTPVQVTNYMNAVERFTPLVNLTGANRSWKAIVVAVRGILVKDSTKLTMARDGLSAIFPYALSGDGFYRDGSFIQHATIPYNGGYGLDLLLAVSDLMAMLHGSPWEVTDPNSANVWGWVYDAYEPLIYKGAMMDMVRGREISRVYRQDHAAGHVAIQGILRLAEIAPAPQALDFRRMVIGWLQADTFLSFYDAAPVPLIAEAKTLMTDPSLAPRDALMLYRPYPAMDRAVQHRPDYAIGLGMYSSRISSFEAINSENAKAWYTSAGMISLYNSDLGHYSEDYWPTVDPYRLPGTTVLSQTATPTHRSSSPWTGGTVLDEENGVAGMDLNYSGHALNGRKSWFLFDDEVVALGSGITSTDGVAVETIVENRKLDSTGQNALTVDGALKPQLPGWSDTLVGVSWMHLAGSNGPGADIGYYFPQATDVKAVREARTGNWRQINIRSVTPTTPVTRNYQTLWLDHGVNPADESYQYVLLPGRSAAEVANYAASPEIEVLANTQLVQAVRETGLGVTAVNIWTDQWTSAGGISANRKSSVMTREDSNGGLSVAVSDPTQLNSSSIELELDYSASSFTAEPGITVTQLSPTVKLTVQVAGAKGRAFTASFEPGTAPPPPPPPVSIILDNADPSGVTRIGAWKTASTQIDRYGPNYLHDDNRDKGTKSVVYTPDIPTTGNYRVYMMWPAHFNRSTAIPVDIIHSGGSSSVTIDQTQNGGVWVELGNYPFNEGTSGSVTISNTGTTGFVVADAVKLELVE
ncbi:polysaccharide lyase family 8 super-sandwich domain-containing protein [Paenibacillus daejeonensis]|uniref:polysaccharide lyase family 8 super-sandwich domain-containing protein n=1 Tax=Paenibacillus daejeonensis TaxID=135193 RepID=UPI0003A618AC|nr:polysaccharide lyase family 8 super-sandwich domain-containing protein [Paenibacillus daejeonensis]